MVFSDLFFLYVFLPSFALLYLLGTWIDKSAAKGGQLSCRARNAVLVAFSFIFYAWGEPVYVFLMLVCVIINFFIGRSIDHDQKLPVRAGLGKDGSHRFPDVPLRPVGRHHDRHSRFFHSRYPL